MYHIRNSSIFKKPEIRKAIDLGLESRYSYHYLQLTIKNILYLEDSQPLHLSLNIL
jgi:hypothetical protein